MMMLCWENLYPGCRSSSSHLSGPYFRIFSSVFICRFSIQGLLISIRITAFFTLSMTCASIRFAQSSTSSAKRGTSQKALSSSFSYTGFGLIRSYYAYSSLGRRLYLLRIWKKNQSKDANVSFQVFSLSDSIAPRQHVRNTLLALATHTTSVVLTISCFDLLPSVQLCD